MDIWIKTKKKLFVTLADKIDNLRGRQQKLKDAEADRVQRDKQGEEFKAYLAAQDLLMDKFDEDLFWRLVNKVKVQSMVKVIFAFKGEQRQGGTWILVLQRLMALKQILSYGMYK